MALLWFYGLFYIPLASGSLFRRYQSLAGLLMRLIILCLEAPIFIYSFWILDLKQVSRFMPIPMIAAFLVLLLLWSSPVWARRLHRSLRAQGSFILTAGFSNIGSTGGAFICYLLYGLKGLSLAYLFLFPYPLIIFTLGFSIAKRHASDDPLSFKDYMMNIMTNVFSLIPLLAIGAGLVLNLSNTGHPALFQPIMDAVIKLDLGLMCFAIGMTVQYRKMAEYLKSITAIAFIKFIISPLLALIAVMIIYGSWSPLPARIILIQAAMPPAIYTVITTNLFNLDRELANSLWLANTLLLIPIAAIIYFLGGRP